MKVLVIGGLASSLINFRGPMLRAFGEAGFQVHAAASGDDPDVAARLDAYSMRYHPVRISRAGINPFADLLSCLDLWRLIRRLKPEIVFCYTIKPVIYGGLVAWVCGVPKRFAMITGLGYAFLDSPSLRQRLASCFARGLYRVTMKKYHRVFFQNPDDANYFVGQMIAQPQQTVVINGSGVDTSDFAYSPVSRDPPDCRFQLIARLLRDKGVMEYLEAGRKIREEAPRASYELVGDFDPNPASLKQADLDPYLRDGVVKFHGPQTDVRPYLSDCDVYVLPSYREGTPRTVLEAMATGRAIITTDAPGCRETVRPMREEQRPEISDVLAGGDYDAQGWLRIGKLKVGTNGILIPVKDVDSLVQAMRIFIEHRELIPVMGFESRRYAEERYDVHKVNVVILRAMGLATTQWSQEEEGERV